MSLVLDDSIYVHENCLRYTLVTYTEIDVEHMLAASHTPAGLREEGFV